MDQLIFAFLSHTHTVGEVGMLKVPAVTSVSTPSEPNRETIAAIVASRKNATTVEWKLKTVALRPYQFGA